MRKYIVISSLFFLPINSLLAMTCKTKKELIYENKTVELCFEQKQDLYLSAACKDIKKCFITKSIKLDVYPNQSPGFSLCYQLGGQAFFAEIKGSENKIPMCKLGSHFVDQENLLIVYYKK